jgi:hypothetical protein
MESAGTKRRILESQCRKGVAAAVGDLQIAAGRRVVEPQSGAGNTLKID